MRFLRLARVTVAAVGMASLAACSKLGSSATGDAGVAADGATAQTAPSASSAPGAIAAADTASFTGAMRGIIDGKHAIVMHLVHGSDGHSLEGTYYYPPSIDDIKVHGTLTAAGVVHLDETVGGKATGSFDGHLDSHDSVDGTWTDAKKAKTMPFHLDLVRTAAPAPAVVVERKASSKKKPTKPFDKTVPTLTQTCDLDVAWPDILGAITPVTAEAKVDALLRTHAMSDLPSDEAPFTVGASYTIRANSSGIFSVEQPINAYAFQAARPNYAILFTNVSLPSGKILAMKDFLTPAGIAFVSTQVVNHYSADKDFGMDAAAIKEMLATGPLDFSLQNAGMLVSIFNFVPHAMQGGASEPLPIAAKDLATMRIHPSPVDDLWGK